MSYLGLFWPCRRFQPLEEPLVVAQLIKDGYVKLDQPGWATYYKKSYREHFVIIVHREGYFELLAESRYY